MYLCLVPAFWIGLEFVYAMLSAAKTSFAVIGGEETRVSAVSATVPAVLPNPDRLVGILLSTC